MKKQQGITLIEGLTAIAFIALVMVLFTIALFGARKESRDVKRVSDIQSLRSSMAAIKVQFGSYLDAGCQPGPVSACQTGNLAQVMPTITNFNDPRGTEFCTQNCNGPCQYAFNQGMDENDYQVLFYLEKGIGKFSEPGCYSLSHQGISKIR